MKELKRCHSAHTGSSVFKKVANIKEPKRCHSVPLSWASICYCFAVLASLPCARVWPCVHFFPLNHLKLSCQYHTSRPK